MQRLHKNLQFLPYFSCLAGGILTGLAFDIPRLSFLIWFSLVPFFAAIYNAGFKNGIIRSLIFGVAFYAVTIFWISNVTKLGLVFLVLIMAVFPVLFFIIARWFWGKPLAFLSVPAVWVLVELFKENFWCGISWADLGFSQYLNCWLVQPVDIFGVKFISFLIVMVNILILDTLLKKVSDRQIFIAAFFLGFCFGYSFYRLHNLPAESYVKVSLVQPNTAEEEKSAQDSAAQVVKRLAVLTKNISGKSLVIFPEAAWPFLIEEDSANLRDFVGAINHSVLLGMVQSDNGFFNRVTMFDADGGRAGVYNKIKLVPFGEYVPLAKIFSSIPALNGISDLQVGKEIKIFSYDNKNFGTLICFEDTFSDLCRQFAGRSDFLVNVTNDAWFKGEPEASQHLGIMAMRAIENRISFVRCANSGISGTVSFRGEITKLKQGNKETFFAGVGSFDVPINSARSIFNRIGDIFSLLCAVWVGIIFFIARRNKYEG